MHHGKHYTPHKSHGRQQVFDWKRGDLLEAKSASDELYFADTTQLVEYQHYDERTQLHVCKMLGFPEDTQRRTWNTNQLCALRPRDEVLRSRLDTGEECQVLVKNRTSAAFPDEPLDGTQSHQGVWVQATFDHYNTRTRRCRVWIRAWGPKLKPERTVPMDVPYSHVRANNENVNI